MEDRYKRRSKNQIKISLPAKSSVAPPGHSTVFVELPQWMIDSIEKEAQRLGVSRRFLMRKLIEENLET